MKTKQVSWIEYLDQRLKEIGITGSHHTCESEDYGLFISFDPSVYNAGTVGIETSIWFTKPQKHDLAFSSPVQEWITVYDDDYSFALVNFLFTRGKDKAKCVPILNLTNEAHSQYLSFYQVGNVYPTKRVIDDIVALARLKKDDCTLDDILRGKLEPEALGAFKRLYAARFHRL